MFISATASWISGFPSRSMPRSRSTGGTARPTNPCSSASSNTVRNERQHPPPCTYRSSNMAAITRWIPNEHHTRTTTTCQHLQTHSSGFQPSNSNSASLQARTHTPPASAGTSWLVLLLWWRYSAIGLSVLPGVWLMALLRCVTGVNVVNKANLKVKIILIERSYINLPSRPPFGRWTRWLNMISSDRPMRPSVVYVLRLGDLHSY